MNGLVALLGSGEYLPVMNAVDRFLLESAAPAGKTPRVVCLPTAAGQEGQESWSRWMRMGEEHFRALGADVSGLPVVDRESAEEARFAEQISGADLVYFSGGKPGYLYETLRGSKAWEAVTTATGRGAAFAGCSAGAMFLGEFLPDMRSFGLRQQKAFGLLPKSHIFPHFDRMLAWRGMTMPVLQALLPAGEYVLGLDEDTALVGHLGGEWQVMGRQKVFVITHQQVLSFAAGEKLHLP